MAQTSIKNSETFFPSILALMISKVVVLRLMSIERNVILEDLLRHIKSPCVMDVKIGRRLYDDDATQEKRQKMEEQTLKTTSGSVGLRICGLKVRQSHNITFRSSILLPKPSFNIRKSLEGN
jgi:hypothetical protein